MGDWLTRSEDGRWRVDLHQLPRWAHLTIAVVVVGLVVTIARLVEPNPHVPDWAAALVRVGGRIVLGLVAFVLVRWLVVSYRRGGR